MNDFVEEQMGRRGRQTSRKWTHVHLLSSFAASSSCVSLFLRPEWHRTEALFPLVLLLKSRPKSGQDALPALPKKRRRRRPNVPTFIDPPPSSSQGGCLLWFSSVSYILYNRLLFFLYISPFSLNLQQQHHDRPLRRWFTWKLKLPKQRHHHRIGELVKYFWQKKCRSFAAAARLLRENW